MLRFIALVALIACTPALALDKKFLPQPSAPKSDFQRSLDSPIRPNPPPTALEKLERGQIPSSENAKPSGNGLSPTVNPPGVEYKTTY
jgi:hypothetical protein